MKLKKFLSTLLLGGMVALNVPARALTEIERTEIRQNILDRSDVSNFRLDTETLEYFYGFICRIDAENRDDIIFAEQMAAFLKRAKLALDRSKSSQERTFYALANAEYQICSSYKVLNKEFSREEYKLAVDDLLMAISHRKNEVISAELNSPLGIRLERMCRFLIQTLSQNANSRGLEVPGYRYFF